MLEKNICVSLFETTFLFFMVLLFSVACYIGSWLTVLY